MASLQAVAALTAALLALSACKEDDLERTMAFLKGDQARLDQLNQDQDGRIAALYAQVSSQAQESTSSSSSIAASQMSSVAAIVPGPSSSVVPVPEPVKEPCTESLFRVYTCVGGFREYW